MANTMSKYGSNTNRPLSEIVGLSTDTKPTDSIEGIKIQNGSSFRELDTGKKFLFDAENTTWNEVSSGGGGGSTLIEKSISANGVYNASEDSADGYSKVTVDVANSYTQADEGKVVSNGSLVSQTTHAEITENGIYDITTNNSVNVNVSGGGSSVEKKDVNFYDYDGTIVNSYTATEFAELTALPDNPSHDGLTAQGWNWTLANSKTYVASYGKLNIGQMYITSDGKTRLYIKLEEGRLKPYLGLTGNSNGTTITIDWGDNSSVETIVLNNTTVYTPHQYANCGEYIIVISVTNGTISFTGSSNTSDIFRKSTTPNQYGDKVYSNILTKLEMGDNVTSISSYAFASCFSLRTILLSNTITILNYSTFDACSSLIFITIPKGVLSLDTYCFNSCRSLKNIALPDTLTSISSYTFDSCYSLKSITIPETVTSFGAYAFESCGCLNSFILPNSIRTIPSYFLYTCSSLPFIKIPDNVGTISMSAFQYDVCLSSVTFPINLATIGSNAFDACRGLGQLKFLSTTPPSVQSGAFRNLPTDCIIYVPTGTLSAYTSTENMPSSSTYTYVEY